MIVRQEGEELVIVRQADHAHLSGALAAAWGEPPWAVPVPFPSVVVGARLHDDAWVGFDEAPALTEDGRPRSFFEVDRELTSEMYRRGVDAVAVHDRYAGLLVSLHYSGFFHGHWDWEPFARPGDFGGAEGAALRRFVDGELIRQAGLREELGIAAGADSDLAANYRWLQLWDRVSLDICRQDATQPWAVDYPEVPVSYEPGAPRAVLKFAMVARGHYTLSPFPLRGGGFPARLPATRIRHLPGERPEVFLARWRTARRSWIEARIEPA
ncbi:MAG: hypothetical protein QOE92_1609 [Chloroflexota bacterium]|jgi:hypothetical protein|nr:hypothetical protein [Chloroflexota bacterium]